MLLTAMPYIPQIEVFWSRIFLMPYRREKTTKALQKAASALEETFKEMVVLDGEVPAETWTSIGRLSPSHLIRELRVYSDVLNFGDKIAGDMEVRSIEELAKFLMTSYVKRTTGSFNDKRVSSLIEETSGLSGYNETAHRMWRSRNYPRLEKHCLWLTEVMLVFGSAAGLATT
jgi:hypothetical protein